MIQPLARAATFLRSSDGGLTSRLIRSGFWVSVSLAALASLQLVRQVVLARLLTPDVFGMMAICLMVIRGVDLFAETGIRPALIHRRERFEEARDTGFTIMASRGLFLALVAAALAPLAAWYYGEPRLRDLIFVLALSFVVTGLTNMRTVDLEKNLEFRRLTMIEQVGSVGGFVAVVSLAWMFRSIWALVIGQVLSAVATVVASYALVPGRPRFRFDRQLARELLRYGRFVTGLTIVLFITTELDNAVVGKLLGMEALGFYLVAYTLANLPATHLSKVLSRLMFPAYNMLRDDRARLEVAYLNALQVVGALALAIAAGLMALADDLVRVAYGERWLPVVASLRVLAFFGAFRAIGSINGYLFNAIGRPDLPFYLNLAKLVLIVAAIVPATLSYSVVGTALAVTIPTVAAFFISLAMLQSASGIRWSRNLQVLARPAASAVAMALVLVGAKQLIGSRGLASLLALIVLGVVTFGALNLPTFGLVMQLLRRKSATPTPAVAESV